MSAANFSGLPSSPSAVSLRTSVHVDYTDSTLCLHRKYSLTKSPAMIRMFNAAAPCRHGVNLRLTYRENFPAMIRMINTAASFRHGVSDAERKLIRQHHSEHSAMSQAALAAYFSTRFGHKISQATVYRTLSERYAWLDLPSGVRRASTRQRRSKPKYPALEHRLFDWQMLLQAQGVRLTGVMISNAAREFWRRLKAEGVQEPYSSTPCPRLDWGFLYYYQERYNCIQPYNPRRKVASFEAGKDIKPPSRAVALAKAAEAIEEVQQYFAAHGKPRHQLIEV